MANPLEKAFQRHSRAQLPTVPVSGSKSVKRLSYIQSTPSWVPPTLPAPTREESKHLEQDKVPVKTSAWVDFIRLGKLVQGDCETLVCSQRDSKATLFMFKLVQGRERFDLKRVLDLRHPNILMARHIIESDVDTHIGFDYFRYTLEEALNVHLAPQEAHVHAIAAAVRYADTECWQYLS